MTKLPMIELEGLWRAWSTSQAYWGPTLANFLPWDEIIYILVLS